MQREPTIKSLTVTNLLSFGDDSQPIELRNLNVLIGPNGSGKSNLIEVTGLLQSAPKELASATNAGGPIEDWLSKGGSKAPPSGSIKVAVNRGDGRSALHYRLAFAPADYHFAITNEQIKEDPPYTSLSPYSGCRLWTAIRRF